MDGGKKEDRMRSTHHVTAMLLGLTSTGKLWEAPYLAFYLLILFFWDRICQCFMAVKRH